MSPEHGPTALMSPSTFSVAFETLMLDVDATCPWIRKTPFASSVMPGSDVGPSVMTASGGRLYGLFSAVTDPLSACPDTPCWPETLTVPVCVSKFGELKLL